MNVDKRMRQRSVVGIGLLVFAVVQAGILAGGQRAYAVENLVNNPSMEVLDTSGFPQCWEASGWGDNAYSFTVSDAAHGGSKAMSITISSITNGDRKAMMQENSACAPRVTPGHQYRAGRCYRD